ncbi:MAG: hypothetical protein ACRDL7_02460 [Gaiellaceae bacterium]
MRRLVLITGLVLGLLMLAGLGALISLVGSVTSIAPSLDLERSTAQ